MGLDEVTNVCGVIKRFNTESQRTLSGSYTKNKYKFTTNTKDTWQTEKYFLTYKANNGLIYSFFIRKIEQLTNTQLTKEGKQIH